MKRRWIQPLFFLFALLSFCFAFAGPSTTTYQAKIIKPDGYPLESSNVNFKFTILNPAGSCILYSEIYSSVNMSSTGGLISFALGSGVKTYPVSATTFEQIFSNITPTLSCDVGGPATYSPAASDSRKIVMQFHDGAGWQTLPAMSINAVPYAMFANQASNLNGKTDSDFVQVANLASCGVNEALHYNGAGFTCAAFPTASAVSAAAVVSALGYTPAPGASVTALTSSLSTTDATVASVSSTVFSVSSTVTSLSNSVSTLQSTVAASFAAITSSQWVTSGTTISYNLGNVFVSGGVRIGFENNCSASLAGTLRYNSGVVEYCNGASWSAFGVAGAGITAINGLVSGSQTFAVGSSGLLPNISSLGSVHSFNFPNAASAGVTAGLISNADYDYITDSITRTATSFTAFTATQATNTASFAAVASTQAINAASFATLSATKITSSAASIAEVLGYVPASATASANYLVKANNLSDLTSAASARSNLGLGGFATVSSLDLGSASATGTLAEARLPSFANITSGTQYTKVTVDGKGRVTSGAQLASTDVTTALGYTPASASAATQWLTSGTTISYSSGNVGIGTSAPTGNLHVSGLGQITGVIESNSDTNGSILRLVRRRTTNGPLLEDDYVGGVKFQGMTSAGTSTVTGAIESYVDGAPLVNKTPGRLVFSTTSPIGTTTERMRIDASGLVGIGTTTPVTRLDVSGAIRISMDLASCAVSYAGSLRYNAGAVEYCNGTVWSAFGVATSGLTTLNGSASQTQSFANSLTGTAPAYVTTNGVHTLNIPYASAGSVTAGLISNADYLTFNNKITSSAASVAQVLGYVPASASAMANYLVRSNNLSDLTSVPTARSNLGLGSFATASSLDLGSASATGTIAEARLPSSANVTSGTQYTKVTVDGKGRVTSGGQIAALDITTALGYAPVSSTAATQWTTNGSNIGYTTGKVGIGTTSPVQPLHVHTSAGSDPGILMTDGDVSHPFSPFYSFAPANTAALLYPATGGGLGLYGFTSNNTAYGMSFGSYQGTTTPVLTAAFNFTAQKSNGAGGFAPLVASETLMTIVNSNIPLLTLKGTGNLGLGTQTPSALLHLAAGTASLPSFKLTSGTLLSSPQSGTIEFDGANFYITDGTNSRRTIASTSGNQTNTGNNSHTGSNTFTGQTYISNNTTSTNSQTGALVVSGGVGIGGTINIAGNANVSGSITTSANIQGVSITATSGMISPYIYGGTGSAGNLTIESTTHATKGFILMVPNGGSVGIGTAAPTARLEINTGTASTIGLIVKDSGSQIADLTQWKMSDGSQIAQISRSGLTIGPDSLFASSGSLRVLSQNSAIPAVVIKDAGSSTADGLEVRRSDELLLAAFGRNRSYFGTNVGIGATSPSAMLDVRGTANFQTSSANAFRFTGIGSGYADAVSGIFTVYSENSAGSGGNVFKASSAFAPNAFVIKDTGSVGIGNTSPSYQLDTTTAARFSSSVSGGIRIGSGQIRVDSSSDAGNGLKVFATQLVAGSDNSVSYGYSGGGLLAARSAADGALLIEATRTSGSGAVQIRNTTAGEVSLNLINSAGNSSLFASTNSGYMGLGTNSPNTTLDVSGALTIREMAAPALAPANQGRIYFDATTDKFRVSQNGGAYTDLATLATTSGTFVAKTGDTMSGLLQINDFAVAGTKMFAVGDDSFFTDVDVANTMGIYGNQDPSVMNLRLGSSGATLTGANGRLGIGIATPQALLQVGNYNPEPKTRHLVLRGGWDSIAVRHQNLMTFAGTEEGTSNPMADTGPEVAKNWHIGMMGDSAYWNQGRFSFVKAGVEQMTILSTGSVGMGGVSNPAAALHIKGNARDYMVNRAIAGATEDGTGINYILLHKAYNGVLFTGDYHVQGKFTAIRGNGGWNRKISTEINTASAHDATRGSIISYNEGSRLVTLTYGGVSYLALEIINGSQVYNMSFTGYAAASDGELLKLVYDTDVLSVTAFTGAVGGGSGGPDVITIQNKLMVGNLTVGAHDGGTDDNGDYTIRSNGQLNINANSSGAADAAYVHLVLSAGTSTSTNSGIRMNTLGAERMRIEPNGYVGIGTSAPTAKLHVVGGANISAITGGEGNGAGNFHLDAAATGPDRAVYLNWFSGNGGAKVGNGASNWGAISASAFNVSSDKRLKENIRPIPYALEKVMQLDAVTFTWKDETRHNHEGERLGLIAQNVEKVFPQAVRTDRGIDTLPGGTKLVSYSDLVSPIIAAVQELYKKWFADSQELHKIVDQQAREIATVKEENEKVKKENEEIKARLERLEKLITK